MSGLSKDQVEAMSESELYGGLALIGQEIKRREEGSFAETVREYLNEPASAGLREPIEAGGGALRLEFTTDCWDDGWFYNEHQGVFTLRDGGTVEEDFAHTVVHDALTELSGVRRREQGLDRYGVLLVDLVTGEVRHDVRP